MNFLVADEDDADFTPSASSHLASLFGMDHHQEEEGNKSLTYTAPKQPKKGHSDSAASTGYATQQESEVSQLTLLYAVAVHTHKLDDGKYVSIGKLGAAVLGSHEAKVYQLILYKGKQQQVLKTKITQNFTFVVQEHNYANFYDGQQQNWSLLFDSSEVTTKFAKQVALAKANSVGNKLDMVIIQDLVPGEGFSLEANDSAEIKYTGWLLKGNTVGQIFDSNTNADNLLRVKLGKGKVIKGLEEGLLGTRKGCKRFLIIPSSLGYGTQGHGNNVPPKTTLVFEVEVVKVKVAKDKEMNVGPPRIDASILPQAGEQANILKKERTDSAVDESTIKARGASLSEALTNSPKSDKAKIISRMAKMGQPMLPLHGAVVAQPSDDSDIEDEVMYSSVQPSQISSTSSSQADSVLSPKTTKPKPQTRPHMPSHHTVPFPQPAGDSQATVSQSSYGPQQVSVYQPPALWQQQQIMPSAASAYVIPHGPVEGVFPTSLATVSPAQPVSLPVSGVGTPTSVMDTHLPLLLTETRTQNTEVRIVIGKISDKLDQVHSKVDQVQQQLQASQIPGTVMPFPYSVGFPSTSLASQQLDPAALTHSIQKIVQENEKLKLELADKDEKIVSQNDKISQLLESSQRFIEESNTMLQQRSDSLYSTSAQSQARILSLEEEKLSVTMELCDALTKISSLQMKLNSQQQREGEQKLELSCAQEQVEKLRQAVEQNQEQTGSKGNIANLEQNLQEVRLSNKAQEEKLASLMSMNKLMSCKLSEKEQELEEKQKQVDIQLKEIKEQRNTEIEELKSVLQKQSLTQEGSSTQCTMSESELNDQWQQKLERHLADITEKHRQEIRDLNEETAMLEKKLEEVMTTDEEVWKKKHRQMEEKAEETEARLQEFQNSVQELRNQYEAQISVLTDELKTRRQSHSDQQSTSNIVDEVKRIMNHVYRTLVPEFEPEEEYQGEEIRKTLLSVIRTVTLDFLEEYSEPVDKKDVTTPHEKVRDEDRGKETKTERIVKEQKSLESREKMKVTVLEIVQTQVVEKGLNTAKLEPLNDADNGQENSLTLSEKSKVDESSESASEADRSFKREQVEEGDGTVVEIYTGVVRDGKKTEESTSQNELKEDRIEEKRELEKTSAAVQNSNKSSRDSSSERITAAFTRLATLVHTPDAWF